MAANKREKGAVRRSQLITTYGVGAIVAVKDESFMIAGIDRWQVNIPNVHEPRLERSLRVQGFVLPPAGEDGKGDVPVVRFPTMYSCPECNRLALHKFFARPTENTCARCARPLVPSRFVMVCSRGHIDDFPYFEWVHKGTRPTGDVKHELSIEAYGVSAALSDIVIKCSCGTPSTTMYGAFGRDALKYVKKCTGNRPWLEGPCEECPETPRTLQRGASNVYFPIVRSSLSIPPWSEGAFKIINRYWPAFNSVMESALPGMIDGMGLARGTGYTVDDLVLAVKQRKQRDSEGDSEKNEAGFRLEEYEALVMGKVEASSEQDFVCIPAETLTGEAAEWFDRVMLVKRLREVRVLEKFTRLLPPAPGDPAERRAPLSREPLHWLPAIEVLGEGVFLRLDVRRLKAWESLPGVIARARRIDKNYAERFAALGLAPDRTITPRLLLIHTLAHMFVNQWSLDAGYPAASLRERLYADDDMCGFLIYTATTDAAGSLGGLVAQADSRRLNDSLAEALVRAAWCSSDPLCIEADAAGVDSLNLAACHACVLLPETSCESANLLLDRGLIVGTPDASDLGLFASVSNRR